MRDVFSRRYFAFAGNGNAFRSRGFIEVAGGFGQLAAVAGCR